VRVCGEGMDVWALGIANRNSAQLIMPNKQEHLECEECGMCIDVCPVGALTSGAYRYKTRPWEMKHVGTICTHCADGCTTTLGVRPSPTGARIIRGSNRDKTGINGDFLCIKGRYAFDFIDHSDRLKQPLIRREGKLQSASWNETLSLVADRFRDVRDKHGGTAIGVIGSTRTTNEEDYFLQKIAAWSSGRTILTITGRPISLHSCARWGRARRMQLRAWRRSSMLPRSFSSATTPHTNTPFWPGKFETTCACMERDSI
jgi:NADH-quinone oxidoreductase subunit G